MANPSKAKGDRAELQAVEFITDVVPHLVVDKPMRALGAGRMDDEGDLRVLPDVAIQVRNYKLDQIGLALRSSGTDAVVQAENGDKPFALGLVPYPRARAGSVRWLASWVEHPVPASHLSVYEFKTVSKALDWVRDDEGPYGYHVTPRESRVARLSGRGSPVFVAPAEAWFAMYETTRTAVAEAA